VNENASKISSEEKMTPRVGEKKSEKRSVGNTLPMGMPLTHKSETTMQETAKESKSKSGLEKLNTTQPTDLNQLSNALIAETCHSSKLIDSTVSDLRCLMKEADQVHDDPIQRAQTIVASAKTINDLIKTKVDAMKLVKDVVMA